MDELDKLRAAVREIWRIAHVPTPSGTKAYTHFQRDFDQIRTLCKPWVETDDD